MDNPFNEAIEASDQGSATSHTPFSLKRNWPREQAVARLWLGRIRAILAAETPKPPVQRDLFR